MIKFQYTVPNDENDDGTPKVIEAVAQYRGADLTRVVFVRDGANPAGPFTELRTVPVTYFIFPTIGKARRDKGVLGRYDFVIPPEQYANVFGRAAIVAQAGPTALVKSIEAWAIENVRFFQGGVIV